MAMFKNWRKFAYVEKMDKYGATIIGKNEQPILEKQLVPEWDKEHAVRFLKSRDYELAQNACRDGWQSHLIDFIQKQHRLPNAKECEEIVLEFQKVECAIAQSEKLPKITAMRTSLKELILS